MLSISQIIKKGKTVTFDSSGGRIYNYDNQLITTGNLVNDIFKLNICMPTCLSEVDSKHVTLMSNTKGEVRHKYSTAALGQINPVSLNKI